MKRICVILLAAAMLLPMAGCGMKLHTLTDAEAAAILREKGPEARALTDFFYGSPPLSGEIEIDPAWTTAHYFPLAADYRFQTEAQVREAAEKVYTAEFLGPVYAYCFDGSDDFTSRYGEYEGRLTLDVTKPAFGQMPTLDYGSARVVKGTRFTCRAEVTADNGKKYEIDFSYDKELGDWKFDSLVY